MTAAGQNLGHWAVVETGQGGGMPDTLHGPYWDHSEAAHIAKQLTSEARASDRRDRYQVAALDTELIDYDEDHQ